MNATLSRAVARASPTPWVEVLAPVRHLQGCQVGLATRPTSLLDVPPPHLFEVAVWQSHALSRRRAEPTVLDQAPASAVPSLRLFRMPQRLLVGHSRILNEAEAERQPTYEVPFPLHLGFEVTVGDVKELLGLSGQQVLRKSGAAWDVLRDTDTVDLTDMTVEYRAAKTSWAS